MDCLSFSVSKHILKVEDNDNQVHLDSMKKKEYQILLLTVTSNII